MCLSLITRGAAQRTAFRITKIGSGVSVAKGAAALQPLVELFRNGGDGKFEVAVEARCEEWRSEKGSGVRLHTIAQAIDLRGGKREADGVGVASETGEDGRG